MSDPDRETTLAPVEAPAPAVTTSAGTVKVPPIAVPAEPVRLFNRELSWLEFNRRVLAEADDASVPLLERVKFLSIAANNLDEFLMVRVGSIRDLVTAGIVERSPDGLTPKQQLKSIRERIRALMMDMYKCWDDLVPELKKSGIRIESWNDLSKKEQSALSEMFQREMAAVLTPLAVDPGHPFPFLASRALTMALVLESERGESHIALLKVPTNLPRLIGVPESNGRFVRIESLIEEHLSPLFPGLKIRKCVPFRVIRNADILLQEDEVQDLLKSVESELRRRERKEVVWVEVMEDNDLVTSLLMSALNFTRDDLFIAPGLLKMAELIQLYGGVGKQSLKEPPFNPRIPSQLATTEDMFSIIRKGDVLLHRPYDSFSTVIEFVQAAAEDPDVVAIKQTLYRTDTTGSAIVAALAGAAQRGKQVTAIVELQARFDEMKNITWARQLEEAGVQVVYGLVGIKTHCKICLVVRREGTDLRRYVHLSSGNYNASTGRLYTDIDLMTVEDSFGEDASQLMNLLTGYSLASIQEIFDRTVLGWKWKRFAVAPIDYHQWTLRMIERETKNATDGKPAQILAKMNSLVDPVVIEALYRASQAGVKLDLIVRGICCLVPGVDKLSENIRVFSIVDRFLEHSRLFLFRNGGETEVYASSGDWMPRNFFRRIELTWPILAPALKERCEKEILGTCLSDNVKAWKLQPDGTYKRRGGGDEKVRSQERFIEIARSDSIRIASYEEAIIRPGTYRRKAKRHRKKEKEKSKS